MAKYANIDDIKLALNNSVIIQGSVDRKLYLQEIERLFNNINIIEFENCNNCKYSVVINSNRGNIRYCEAFTFARQTNNYDFCSRGEGV